MWRVARMVEGSDFSSSRILPRAILGEGGHVAMGQNRVRLVRISQGHTRGHRALEACRPGPSSM